MFEFFAITPCRGPGVSRMMEDAKLTFFSTPGGGMLESTADGWFSLRLSGGVGVRVEVKLFVSSTLSVRDLPRTLTTET